MMFIEDPSQVLEMPVVNMAADSNIVDIASERYMIC